MAVSELVQRLIGRKEEAAQAAAVAEAPIRVRVRDRTYYLGHVVEEGVEIEVSAAEALALLNSWRFELVNPDDFARVRAESHRQARELDKSARVSWVRDGVRK